MSSPLSLYGLSASKDTQQGRKSHYFMLMSDLMLEAHFNTSMCTYYYFSTSFYTKAILTFYFLSAVLDLTTHEGHLESSPKAG